jgi:ribonuclease HI
MAEEGNNLKLMWFPVHTGIQRNEEADEAAKESREQEVETTQSSKRTGLNGQEKIV